ncbi:MAG: Jag family protein [Candidatus Bipolaricaulia bacterium]
MRPEVEAAIREYLSGLLKSLGEPVELELQEEDGELVVNLQGVTVFSGQDRAVIRALDYLLELALRRRLKEGGRANLRVHLDIDHYRSRRREELRQTALKLAEEAKRDHKRIRLNPMEPWERKAIHEALADFAGVRTYSEGKGAERRVIIEPTSR